MFLLELYCSASIFSKKLLSIFSDNSPCPYYCYYLHFCNIEFSVLYFNLLIQFPFILLTFKLQPSVCCTPHWMYLLILLSTAHHHFGQSKLFRSWSTVDTSVMWFAHDMEYVKLGKIHKKWVLSLVLNCVSSHYLFKCTNFRKVNCWFDLLQHGCSVYISVKNILILDYSQWYLKMYLTCFNIKRLNFIWITWFYHKQNIENSNDIHYNLHSVIFYFRIRLSALFKCHFNKIKNWVLWLVTMRQYEPWGRSSKWFWILHKRIFLNWKMLKHQESSAAQDIEVILFSFCKSNFLGKNTSLFKMLSFYH